MTGLRVVGEAVRSIVREATEEDGVNVTLFVWKEDATPLHDTSPQPTLLVGRCNGAACDGVAQGRERFPAALKTTGARTAAPLISCLWPFSVAPCPAIRGGSGL